MRNSNELPLSDAIDQFLKRSAIGRKMSEAQVINEWESIVGKPIAAHTKGLQFRGRCLHIQVDSAPLKQELFFLKEKIIEILNKKFTDTVVEDIIIR